MAKFRVEVMRPESFDIEAPDVIVAAAKTLSGLKKWNRDRPLLPDGFLLSLQEIVEVDDA